MRVDQWIKQRGEEVEIRISVSNKKLKKKDIENIVNELIRLVDKLQNKNH